MTKSLRRVRDASSPPCSSNVTLWERTEFFTEECADPGGGDAAKRGELELPGFVRQHRCTGDSTLSESAMLLSTPAKNNGSLAAVLDKEPKGKLDPKLYTKHSDMKEAEWGSGRGTAEEREDGRSETTAWSRPSSLAFNSSFKDQIMQAETLTGTGGGQKGARRSSDVSKVQEQVLRESLDESEEANAEFAPDNVQGDGACDRPIEGR